MDFAPTHHTWHERNPGFEHQQRFRNLLDLHALTRSWMTVLGNNSERPTHLLSRVNIPDISANLEILENLSASEVPQDLTSILDAAYPDEMLTRLEQTIWVSQAWLLRELFQKTPPAEISALRNSLEQASWKAGKACAEERWPLFPAHARGDLRAILAALQDGPLTGYPSASLPYLIKRALAKEIQLDLLFCAHAVSHIEMHPISDEMCRLHSDWTRGFAYALHPQVMLDYHAGDYSDAATGWTVRCGQRWYFLKDS